MPTTGPWQSDLADLGPQTLTINREDHPVAADSDPSEPTPGWEDPSFLDGVNVHRWAQRGYAVSVAVPGGPPATDAWDCAWGQVNFTAVSGGQFWNGDPDSAGYIGGEHCRDFPTELCPSGSAGTSEIINVEWGAFHLGGSQIGANQRFSAVTVDYERIMRRFGPNAGLPIPTLPDNAIGIEWEDDYADWSDLDLAVTRDSSELGPSVDTVLAEQLGDHVTELEDSAAWGPFNGFADSVLIPEIDPVLPTPVYDFDTFEPVTDWWTCLPPGGATDFVTDTATGWAAGAIPGLTDYLTLDGSDYVEVHRYGTRAYVLMTQVLWEAGSPFTDSGPGNSDDGEVGTGLWLGVRIVATAQRYRFIYAAPPVTRQYPRDSYGFAAAPRLVPPARTQRVIGGHH
jgi:hypothetical protein